MPHKDPVKRREIQGRWGKKHPDKKREVIAASQRKIREQNKDNPEYWAREKMWRLESRLRKYGMSVSAYEAMLESQGGLCAVCKRPETKKIGATVMLLAVDHCHKTGRVRGLLCNTCNRAIGLLGDEVEMVEAAAVYLRGVLQ